MMARMKGRADALAFLFVQHLILESPCYDVGYQLTQPIRHDERFYREVIHAVRIGERRWIASLI